MQICMWFLKKTYIMKSLETFEKDVFPSCSDSFGLEHRKLGVLIPANNRYSGLKMIHACHATSA